MNSGRERQAITTAAVLAVVMSAPVAGAVTSGSDRQPSDAEPAIEVLERITVAQEEDREDFDRDLYAPSGWDDADGSGCHTREDILSRDLDADTIQAGPDDCTIEYGEMIDPYSGEWIEHVQGESQVDVEHVYAVGEFARSGGSELDEATKQAFYQDKENLVAVSAGENRSKGDRPIADDSGEGYVPPNQGAVCDFVGTRTYIADKWGMTITQAERDEAQRILNQDECEDTLAAPAQQLVTEDWSFDATADEAAALARGATTAETPEDAESPEDQENTSVTAGGQADEGGTMLDDLPEWALLAGVGASVVITGALLGRRGKSQLFR